MTGRAALLALGVATAAAARAEPPDAPAPGWRLSGEALGAVSTGILHEVGVSSWGLRLGLGGRKQAAPDAVPRTLAWLVTVAGNVSGFRPGATIREGRLGVGVRLHFRRLSVGGDAELVLVDVDRVSTSRPLRGTGLGARLSGCYDLVQLGDAAVFAGLEASLTELGWPASPTYWPALQAGLGLRL